MYFYVLYSIAITVYCVVQIVPDLVPVVGGASSGCLLCPFNIGNCAFYSIASN